MPTWSEQQTACWGNHPVQPAVVARPERARTLRNAFLEPGPVGTTTLARGLGRSYGDAALNEDRADARGRLVLTERLGRVLAFDPETGILEAEAGMSLARLLETYLPQGWFVPVTPGTRFVTLGGCLAADVHGKNHHSDGSFVTFVESFELLLSSGQTVRCSREERPELFWATTGGMGLTGMIISVCLRLRRVDSAYIDVSRTRTGSLDETAQVFESLASDTTYSVAWVDMLARGASLGRGVVFAGEHAPVDRLSGTAARSPLVWPAEKSRSVPIDFPGFALSPLSVKAFNTFYHMRNPTRVFTEPVTSFFYPLDAVRGWNRIYGKRGFQQYQVVIPPDPGLDGLREILDRLAASKRGSFLAVIKPMGAESGGMLSFPRPGWTVSLDLAQTPGLDAMLSELDARVIEMGGRRYLAKDASMKRDHFEAMYPKLDEFRRVRAQADPDGKISSSLARRLGL
ncbi:MAG: FAD-binding oxidoreductase [Planctomycetota bacterium]